MHLQTPKAHNPVITVSAPTHDMPQTPLPPYSNANPFDKMTTAAPGPQRWEALVDDHIALAKECQKPDSAAETLEKLLAAPTATATDNNKAELVLLRGLHNDAVHAARTAYDGFHDAVEALKKEAAGGWEDKLGAAARAARDAMAAGLERFAAEAKAAIIGALPAEGEGEQRVETETAAAGYLCYCVNGYVLFARRVGEALEVVYEARKGGQQRVWTALETAGRVVQDAEAAALKWVVVAAPGPQQQRVEDALSSTPGESFPASVQQEAGAPQGANFHESSFQE